MIRRDWPLIAASDAALLAMLGTVSAGIPSIAPIAGRDLPLPAPWMEWRFGSSSRLGTGTPMADMFVEAWVYDLPGQMYYNIDKIIDRLLVLYPTKVGPLYTDAGGSIVQQVNVFESDSIVDPEYEQNVRWTQWALRRIRK